MSLGIWNVSNVSYALYANECLSLAESSLIFSNRMDKPLSLLKNCTEMSIHSW